MSDLQANVVLSFRDEQGREWLAAAAVGPLVRSRPGKPDEMLEIEDLKDRAFAVLRFTVITRGVPVDTEEEN